MPDSPAPAPTTLATAPKPSGVLLLVDENQTRTMRNTFLFWEAVTLALGLYIGKKLGEPKGMTK